MNSPVKSNGRELVTTVALDNLTQEQLELIKSTVAKDSTNDELSLFIHVCNKTKLDPFARQIYAIKRGGKMTIQTSIDGFRLIAERSGQYAGQRGPWWCDSDGVWKDVWLKNTPPFASKVEVLRHDFKEAVSGIALWSAYNQNQGLWGKMGYHMLSKVAESLALRKAFPQDLSGIHTDDEVQDIPEPQPPRDYETEAVDRQALIDMILQTSTAKTSAKGVTNAQKGVWMTTHWKHKLDDLKRPATQISTLKEVWERVKAAPELQPEAELVKDKKNAEQEKLKDIEVEY